MLIYEVYRCCSRMIIKQKTFFLLLLILKQKIPANEHVCLTSQNQFTVCEWLSFCLFKWLNRKNSRLLDVYSHNSQKQLRFFFYIYFHKNLLIEKWTLEECFDIGFAIVLLSTVQHLYSFFHVVLGIFSFL